MEVIGIGLEAIGSAIGGIASAVSGVCIVAIAIAGGLIYTDKMTIEDLKELINRKRRY